MQKKGRREDSIKGRTQKKKEKRTEGMIYYNMKL